MAPGGGLAATGEQAIVLLTSLHNGQSFEKKIHHTDGEGDV